MNTDFERKLSDALHHRARSADLTPHHVSDVRGRATGIRRRRAALTVAGVAAVLAAGVPTGLAASDLLGPREPTIANPVPPMPVTEVVVVGTDAPAGEAPGIAWLDGGTVHLADGSVFTPEGPHAYRALAVVGDRVLASWVDEDAGMWTIDDLSEPGTSFSARSAPMGESSDGVAAWVDADGGVVVATEDGETSLDLGPAPQVLSVDAAGLWFAPEGDSGAVRRVNLDGVGGTTPLDVVTVKDSTSDLVTATTSVDNLEPGSCGALFEGTTQRWETCEHTLEDIAPGGDWVLGTDAYLDGIGQSSVSILDATDGSVQVSFEMEDGVFVDRVWEDDSHALVLAYSWADQTWQVVRLGLDGSAEEALRSRPGVDTEPPFALTR